MVKRYTQPCVQQQPGLDFKVAEVELFEDARGKWVRFEDYAKLGESCVRLTQHLRQAVEQAEQGVMVEHDCPALYACASILADAQDLKAPQSTSGVLSHDSIKLL